MAKTVILSALVWLVAATCWADELAQQRLANWHQWRGPEATGTAPNGDPPTTWDEQTNIRWKVELPGKGSATPIVWGDRIYILTAIKTEREAPKPVGEAATESRSPYRLVALAEGDAAANTPAAEAAPTTAPAAGEKSDAKDAADGKSEKGGPGEGRGRGGRRGGRGPAPPPTNFYQFMVMCLDRKTGKTLWQDIANEVVPHEGTHQTGSMASASPVTDGKHIYCSFGSRGIFCYDMDGKQVWRRDLGKMQIKNGFGEGASPALHGDTLIINWDHENGSFITALDARTGDEKWKKPRDETTTWNTPLIVEHGGRTQVVVNGTNRARSYDLNTGEVLWECGGQCPNAIPTSVTIDDMAICVTGFRGYAAYAIPLGSTGDITDTDKIAWKLDQGTPYVASPLLYNGRLFWTKDRKGILSSINARTGEIVIDQKRLPGLEDIYASPAAAAGRAYFPGRNGKTVVIDATADDVKVLAENQLDDTLDASPVIVGKELFLRGEKSLYCIAAP